MLQRQPFPHANILQLQNVETCKCRCPGIFIDCNVLSQPLRSRKACVRGNREKDGDVVETHD